MDKKLLLALQFCCNAVGLAVPWNDIGSIMGDQISGGAVIQHLAKLRIRMVEQGLSVPPPLRRGGHGARISTSATSHTKANATPAKISKANNAAPKKTKKGAKKVDPGSDDSEEDGDGWVNDDDSDAEYGERPAKRVKSNAKGASRPRKMKAEDSEEEIATPSKPSKRKRQSENSSDVDIKTEFTAAGASWLQLEDDEDSQPKTGKKTAHKKPSLVVSLPGMVGGSEENYGEMSDNESEDDVVGGGDETFTDGSFNYGNEEVNEGFSTSPYDQGSEPQVDQPPNATNNVELYNNMYSTSPLNMPFTDAFTDTSINQSAGNFGQYDGEFAGIFNNGVSFGGYGGMASGNFPTDSSPYQVGSGYNGSSSAIGTDLNIPLHYNGHDYTHNIPYTIQTSWPNTAGLSNKTSVNQTPADNSAGVDMGAGYFGDNGNFNFGHFNNAVIDYTTNAGNDPLFGEGGYDGNVADGSFFASNGYGD